jgi:hypothetical protein
MAERLPLVDGGARCDIQGHDGKTPSDIAKKAGYTELVAILSACQYVEDIYQ